MLIVGFAGCGGKSEEYEYFTIPRASSADAGHAGTGGSSPSSSGAGSGAAGAADGGASNRGGNAGSSDAAGNTGQGGAAGEANAAGAASGGDSANAGSSSAGSDSTAGAAGDAAGVTPCTTPRDCPAPPNMCIVARCDGGQCGTEKVAAGSRYVLDVPADCHATIACDGNGNAVTTVDQTNAPTPYNPCQVGTCNSAGEASTELLQARTRCSAIPRGLCDGAGNCVECLSSADCPNELECALETHTCTCSPLYWGNCP